MTIKIIYQIKKIIDEQEDKLVSKFARTMGISLTTAKSWRDEITRPRADHLERILNLYPTLTIDMIQLIEEIEPEPVI